MLEEFLYRLSSLIIRSDEQQRIFEPGIYLDLTCEPAALARRRKGIQHIKFGVGRTAEICQTLQHVYVTGGTQGHSSTSSFDRIFAGTQDLHQIQIDVFGNLYDSPAPLCVLNFERYHH